MAPRKRTDASRQLSVLPLAQFPPRIPGRHRRGGTPRLTSEPSAMPAGSAAAEFASIQTRWTAKRCSSSPFVLLGSRSGSPPVFCFRTVFAVLFQTANRRSVPKQIDQPGSAGGRARGTQVDAEHAAQRLLILFLMENEPNQAILDAQVPPRFFPSWIVRTFSRASVCTRPSRREGLNPIGAPRETSSPGTLRGNAQS
jgi:hypothetical protein